VSLKHVINLVKRIRDTRCHSPPPKTKSHPEIWKEKRFKKELWTIARSLSIVAQSLDGENGENPHFPKLLLFHSDCSVVSWRIWLFYASWHDPFDPKSWFGCLGYDKSASSGVTSGNMTSIGAFKHFFRCDTWKMSWTPAKDGDRSRLYATGPHFSSMGNGLM
jgi:hypothetical protein